MTKPISPGAYLQSLFLLLFINYSSAREINKTEFNFSNVMQDTIPPVPYCFTGVITIPMPITGSITIHAKDLDKGSFDNNTPKDKLKFYFNGDRSKDSIPISCSDFLAAGAADDLIVAVQMWVEDEAGNADYCKTVLIFQDNKDVCPNDLTTQYSIKGNIGNDVEAKVTLTSSNGFYEEQSNNPFTFSNLANGIYSLCIERNDDPLNGITTADLVKIHRHILGIELLNLPNKLIAADVNLSNNLSAADFTEMRKLILGITTKFSKVPSWIFIPTDYIFLPTVFPDAKQFIPSCKTIVIKDKSIDNVNFTAIKMGDVTGNAKSHN